MRLSKTKETYWKTIIKTLIFFSSMMSILFLLRFLGIGNFRAEFFLVVVAVLGLLVGIATIIMETNSPEGSKYEQESLKRKRANMTEEEKRREFFEMYGDAIFPWETEVMIILILFILYLLLLFFFR